MNWTTELPTETGYYWLRKYTIKLSHLNDLPEVVGVYKLNNKLIVSFLWEERVYDLSSITQGEWYGPLSYPE